MDYTKLSKASTKKIKNIMLSDYKKQLEKIQNAHKKAKQGKKESKKQYQLYRKKYLLLKNRIMQVKKIDALEV